MATRGRGSDELPVHDEDAVYIYTAISFKQKESCGIIVDLLRYGNHTRILECAVAETTSNNLHILSAVEGLKALRRRLPVHIFTNSSYLRDGAANWLPGWQRRNWQTREGNPVSNRDSWIELAEQLDRYPVQFHVVDKELPPCAMQEAKEMTRELIKS
ncbi:MAG: RNase H family protein [Thermodesulfobacteriota bacterium]